MKKNISLIILPILAGLYPILYFYEHNISELSPKFLYTPVAATLVAAITLSLLAKIIFKSNRKATLASTVIIILFFSYGHISMALNDILFIKVTESLTLGPDKVLLPILTVTLPYFFVMLRSANPPPAKALRYATFVLIILNLYLSVRVIRIETHATGKAVSFNGSKEIADPSVNTPDIYHIILDGYARNDVLEELYGYDNSQFTDSLKKMGFFVAQNARSNYMHTYLSLLSTFNMTYLDSLAETYGEAPPDDEAAAKAMINNNLALNKLKEYGYKTINFASDWDGTNENFQADVTYNENVVYNLVGYNLVTNETSMVFLQTTILSPVIKEVRGDALRGKTLKVFAKLPDIAFQGEKKYVLAHFISPHPPYVFNADGSPVEGAEFEMADEGVDKRPLYLEQLKFMSSQTVPMLQKIIKTSNKPPIIILQSDHGPGSTFGKREDYKDNYSDMAIRERSGILFAIYFPDGDYSQLNDSHTPVNTYSVIFNKYFKEENEILPDRIYYTDYDAVYKFVDVTGGI